MPFVALVMNLTMDAAGSACKGERALDATAAFRLPHKLLAALDPDLRAVLERSLERGLLTLAIIKQGPDAQSLRMTALAEEGLASMSRLLQALARRPALILQQRRWAIEGADLAHSPWAGTSDWADFLVKPGGQTLRFHLGTPLLMPPDGGEGGQRASFFPHPLPVFAELARRWRDLGGPPLPTDALSLCGRGGCVVADYRLRSCRVALAGQERPGFLGWVSYECRSASMDCVAALTALARFAFFAGVGCGASYGLGQARVTVGS
jgi:CRISPR/Cas system endoribonuclease Cas6 (RAMP superfamily)